MQRPSGREGNRTTPPVLADSGAYPMSSQSIPPSLGVNFDGFFPCDGTMYNGNGEPSFCISSLASPPTVTVRNPTLQPSVSLMDQNPC